ncbi:hypothetical protein PH210_19165 [Paenibacillus sp. BSR1-1]|uniref:hypothetical protein n=1 Tax=Paenibacillus sp. BSR1-1 TaxID=3020845 RepID=UPI0025B24CA0|nr:hypothetical protein [Paenibacillus sp. BSR1-1]MDN3018302.1 hypothetical protein [Paenibacillus sp. BSR1-1]
MFFLLLTMMIIAFVVGTVLIIKTKLVFGFIAIGVGIVLLLFILIYYGKNKYRKKNWDCISYLDCVPDCDPDCHGGPDCDCGPDCH